MSFEQDILDVFRKHMEIEKNGKFSYINPHMMQAVLNALDGYIDVYDECNDDISSWIVYRFST